MQLEDKLQMLRRVKNQLDSVLHADSQVNFMISASLSTLMIFSRVWLHNNTRKRKHC